MTVDDCCWLLMTAVDFCWLLMTAVEVLVVLLSPPSNTLFTMYYPRYCHYLHCYVFITLITPHSLIPRNNDRVGLSGWPTFPFRRNSWTSRWWRPSRSPGWIGTTERYERGWGRWWSQIVGENGWRLPPRPCSFLTGSYWFDWRLPPRSNRKQFSPPQIYNKQSRRARH